MKEKWRQSWGRGNEREERREEKVREERDWILKDVGLG